MKKISITLFIAFAFFTIANAQPDWSGKYLQVGYRFGTAGVNITQLTDPHNLNGGLSTQKVGFNTSFWDLRYGNLSKHFYYEADLSGLFLSFVNLVENKNVEDKAVRNYQDPSAVWKTNTTTSLADQLHGSDISLLEFRMGFGGKGIYFGPQLNYYENRFQLFESRYSLAYGLHGAWWLNVKNICRLKTTLMYNTYAKGKDMISYNFKGKDITFDATAYFGKADKSVALYAGIVFTKRFSNKELPGDYHDRLNGTGTIGSAGSFTSLYIATMQSATLFSFKLGVLLSNGKNGDVETGTISISSGNGSERNHNINNGGSNTNTETMCTSCNGKGTYTCTRCGGNGRIPDVKGNGSSYCSSCNGKGYHTCIVCNGRGKK
ncbi:MAG: hypothetical protein RJA07_2376 [Bacteroidota bacterium]